MLNRFISAPVIGFGLAVTGLFAVSYNSYKKSNTLRLPNLVPTPSKSDIERAFAIPAGKLDSLKQRVDYIRVEFKDTTPKKFFDDFQTKWDGKNSYIVLYQRENQFNLINFEKLGTRQAGSVIKVYAEEKPGYIHLTTGFGTTLESLENFPLVDYDDNYVALLDDKELRNYVLAVKPIGKTILTFNGDTMATPREAREVMEELEKNNITKSSTHMLGAKSAAPHLHNVTVPSLIEFNILIKNKLSTATQDDLPQSNAYKK